ncbi:peptide-modifying radical SAM enzyme CbpB [Telmatospirillum sp.]|uniref:peptide-modifying radical SAM enzyme CbpB n=1 Tax=Telmatospirillum sp. TaxID=2079197 RepID=UPI00284BB306|nr:peptide-modifying radical SAM enzyme CbpB [Telmatospirillum sp.]MDR3438252.1 peptide-modifying radical SAM enzyme CbpB [Telmatospirillum sp.]
MAAQTLRDGGLDRGPGSPFQPFDIDHPTHIAVVAPDTAFWALVRKERLAEILAGGPLVEEFGAKAAAFADEIDRLRFHLKPSAVYFNPTERCNLNCSYCYIPSEMRRAGEQMDKPKLLAALETLHAYFRGHMPADRLPQIIFHGAEPLLAREAIFAGIEAFGDRFRFGVQTNATLLDDAAVEFLTSHGVGIGLSLDGPTAAVADRTRRRWNGDGVFDHVVRAIERLDGYAGYNVICTMTKENLPHLTQMVEFFHDRRVPACMLNVTRCTQEGARTMHGSDDEVARAYLAALERTHELYRETGRKLVVANFANILIAILAPTARRLMCDISPCGGGRSFFALAPNGDLFPCSEFIGLAEFSGGNLFDRPIDDILKSPPFQKVIGRKVEDIAGCDVCPIRHFCGSPCPAEAYEMNGGMQQKGAFCHFYEEQVRYALRLIADGRHEDFLWDGWDDGTDVTCAIGTN